MTPIPIWTHVFLLVVPLVFALLAVGRYLLGARREP
jgi:hypothetical protein